MIKLKKDFMRNSFFSMYTKNLPGCLNCGKKIKIGKFCSEACVWKYHSLNKNGSTTGSLQAIVKATAATLLDGKVMIQSEPHGITCGGDQK